MRRVLAILFCLFYLSFSVGVVISFQYCGENLVGVSVFKVNKKDCCGSTKQINKCCKNTTIVYKVKDNHEGTSKQLLPTKLVNDVQLTAIHVNKEVPIIPTLEHKTFLSNAPPHLITTPTYLLNKVFRI